MQPDLDPDSFTTIRPRMFVVAGIFIVLFLVLLVGLFKVQIVDYQSLQETQERQNYRRILIPGPRGDIYDREGRLLVGNRPLFSAVVYLNELRHDFRKEYYRLVREYRKAHPEEESQQGVDRNKIAAQARLNVVQRYVNIVNRILGTSDEVTSSSIEKHFSRELLLPMTLVNDLTQEQYARLIEQLPVDSPIQIQVESARYYPHDRLASHTLGYVVSSEDALDGQDVIGTDDLRTFTVKGKSGRSGLELSFDDELQGKAGGEIWVVDPSGFQQRRTEFKAPVKGRDLITSLDVDLQKAAEDAMGSRTGAVVAMDVRTGEVLVMASEPDYNLNDLSPYIPSSVYEDIRQRGAWINRAVQGLYPPGSTFKMITATAGYLSGTLKLDTTINCPGFLLVGNRKFYNDDKMDHGDLDLRHAIAESNNVFFYTLGIQTGVDAIASAARMYGLGAPTGIELKNETHRSLVPDPDYKKRRFDEGWYAGDTANMAIGQGYLLVTPLQLCSYATSLARRMTTSTPTLLKVDAAHPHSMGGKPLPLDDAQYRSIMDGMRMCVTQGTGRLVQTGVDIPVSGKTGTAQIWINRQESTIAWFICFAPSYDPQIAIAVMIEGTEPGDNLFGGSTSAPIARKVIQAWEAKHPQNPPQQ